MTIRHLALSALFAWLMASAPSRADPKPPKRPEDMAVHVPDHLKLQTGGYVGMVTIGVGAAFLYDHLNLTAYYGWVPSAVGGTEIHVVSLMLALRPASRVALGRPVDWVPPYLGVGGMYTRGDGFFTRLPEQYPGGYYPPNSLRSFALVGSELELEKHPKTGFASHSLYVEVVALDLYVHHWLRNPDTIAWHEVLATAIGYKARLP